MGAVTPSATRKEAVRAIAAVTVLALAGCTPAQQTGGGADRPAVRHLGVAELPEIPAHDDHDRVVVPPIVDADDATAVATDHLVTGLTAQGLTVVDLGAVTRTSTVDRATVRVLATHRLDDGDSHTSIYDISLVRDRGVWSVAAARAVS